MKHTAWLALPLGLTGCVPSLTAQAASDFGCSEEQIVVDSVGAAYKVGGCGKLDVYLHDYAQNTWSALRNRAAFELSCDKDALAVTVIDSQTYGVAGCNKKAVYKRLPYTGFVLDSGQETAPDKQ